MPDPIVIHGLDDRQEAARRIILTKLDQAQQTGNEWAAERCRKWLAELVENTEPVAVRTDWLRPPRLSSRRKNRP